MKEEPGASSSKACDLCYRTKLKCVGRENPPCQRCVAGGHECTFDGRRKSKMTQVENRVSDIEDQIEAMQAHMAGMQRQLADMLHGRGFTTHAPDSVVSTLETPLSHASVNATNRSTKAAIEDSGLTCHGSKGTKRAAGPDSGSSSEEVDEDPLAEVARGAPLGKMLGAGGSGVGGRRESKTSSISERPVKYVRLGGPEHERQPATMTGGEDAGDPVDAGVCTAARGKALLDVFYAHCHNWIPVFDPAVDTWEGLRERSPFALTVAIMVGAKFENESSELQRTLQEHAERIAKETLFAPMPEGFDLETVQAMVILTAWGSASWRTGGHALRLAMEQHLYRCLPHLVQTGMGAFKTSEELEADRPLVIGARAWLAVCKAEMAFNQGRPLLLADETSIALGRQLLDHPFSTLTDSRLVAACELLKGRQRSHLSFNGTTAVSMEQAISEIQRDNRFVDAWHADWMAYYDRINIPHGDFMRDVVESGKNHCILLTNSRLLHGVQSRVDVDALIPERREALSRCVQSASILVRMAVGDSAYREYFLSANSLAHVAITFAARLLIRFATLAPDTLDQRRTGKDIEALALILQRSPGAGASLASQIQQVLSRARNKRVLPPRSRAASPHRNMEPTGLAMKPLMSSVPEPAAPVSTHQLFGSAPDGMPSFDLGDFSDELFNGSVLSDMDTMNIFEWFKSTEASQTPSQGSYDWSQ